MISHIDNITNEELQQHLAAASKAPESSQQKSYVLLLKASLFARELATKPFDEYMQLAARTAPQGSERKLSQSRLQQINIDQLLHAHLGLSSESGEIADAIKKHVFYGKELDTDNLIEEIGDLLWYATLLLDAIGFTLSDAAALNIVKLRERYPSAFNMNDALERKDKSC